ncbi:gamma-glutamyltransferase [Hanstruepera neustonica]|uniref:Glutathione hydrolase proenzyme n=1 Tax=Hanstruepera neustonica TaxID=1445657 RepID=A0A2K1DX50_9FLAO|nr:gamma-glutamyltransferase [Hanstruepera neustonica]PNQ72608.1 gamma-glutamyltransferase [Hanstruepera neustonica]
MKKHLIFFFLLATLIACKDHTPSTHTKTHGLITQQAMVVSAREEASQIGSDILKKGGNAFDALAATELALAVAFPYAGNIGGGGFMVYRLNSGEIGALDYREKAPLAASKNMYLDENGNVVPNKSTLGALAVGVPGSIAGIFETHQRFGTLPLEDIVQPAIDLAKRGVVVTEKQEQRIKKYQPLFREVNKDSIIFDEIWKTGDTIYYSALASTLERIKINGPSEFYEGETAKKLVDFINENGGSFTMEDLKKYKPVWRKPIVFKYDSLKIISMSPPSSGGVCLAQIMKMIEPYDIHEYGHNSKKTIQVIVEAERRAFADRSYYLGDPDFVDIPLDKITDSLYLQNRMDTFTFTKPTPSTDISHGSIEFSESNETTHFSIIDSFGNAVSVTTTINGAYGSKLYCSELGFFLNNEMDDFSSKPGEPNMFGLVGAEANNIAPEKRMLSSMTPTIVEKNGMLYMVLGTRGGSTIITSVLQTILNVHEFGMSMQDAVDAPRFHHQWLPDVVQFEEKKFSNTFKREIEDLGYQVTDYDNPSLGNMVGILVLKNGHLEGGADKRGDDTAVGF